MGIMFTRFSNSSKDLGFPAHRMLQSLGSVLVIAGFITAVAFTEDKGLGEYGVCSVIHNIYYFLVDTFFLESLPSSLEGLATRGHPILPQP